MENEELLLPNGKMYFYKKELVIDNIRFFINKQWEIQAYNKWNIKEC